MRATRAKRVFACAATPLHSTRWPVEPPAATLAGLAGFHEVERVTRYQEVKTTGHVITTTAGIGPVSNGTYRGIAPNAGLGNLRVLNSRGTGTVTQLLAAIDRLRRTARPTTSASST